MIVTEEQAGKLWCPLVRVPAQVRALEDATDIVNRGLNGEPLGACIGARCMMWRWNAEFATQDPNSKGFCGMAFSVCTS